MALRTIEAQHEDMALGLVVIVVVAVLLVAGFWIPAVREWVVTRGGGATSGRRPRRRS